MQSSITCFFVYNLGIFFLLNIILKIFTYVIKKSLKLLFHGYILFHYNLLRLSFYWAVGSSPMFHCHK